MQEALFERLIPATLGPLLIAQGAYARWKTPRLPEPAGEHHGQAGDGPALRVLIAGDSSALGIGVPEQSDAISGHMTAQLAERYRVSWRLLARSGLQTAGAIELLRAHPEERFDLALVSVGGNDVIARVPAARWIETLEQLVDTLIGRFGIQHVVLSPVPPMHEFPAMPQPLRWYIGQRAAHYNRRLARHARAHRQCTLLEMPQYGATASLLAHDGFHPGPQLYEIWGTAAARAVTQYLHLQGDSTRP